MWTAAWQYWYGEIYGIQRPRSNAWWNQSLDIWVYYKNDNDYTDDIGSSEGEYAYSAVTERIAVRAYNRDSRTIFATTIHEIAHSSHYWNMSTHEILLPQVAEFANLPKNLKETYSTGIDWFLTNKRYPNYTPYYNADYTGLFQDLVDTDKRFGNSFKSLNDSVSGFTVPNIESALFDVTTWEQLKAKLSTQNPSGVNGILYTNSAFDKLFAYWRNPQ